MVPAYFMPDEGWDDIIRSAQDYPSVQVTAILNPSNGIFSKTNAQFAESIDALQALNGRVIGYISTDYGNRSLSEVKANVDSYLKYYPKVNGFFLDEMAAKTNVLSFYQEVYDYVKSKDPSLQVVGNPGSYPDASYANVSDMLVTFEGSEVEYRDINSSKNTWIFNKPASAQSMLVHDAYSCASMQNSLKTASLETSHTGVVYVTDLLHDTNPWEKLPTYWDKFMASVQAINKNQSMPAC